MATKIEISSNAWHNRQPSVKPLVEEEKNNACVVIKSKSSNMDRQKLKKTCESCAKSKLKCSGEYPICSRCKKHGRECVYKPRKRRVNKPKKVKSESSSSSLVKRNQVRKYTCLDGRGCIHNKPECDNECIDHIIQSHKNTLLPMLPQTLASSFNRAYNVEKASWNIYSALASTYASSHKYGFVTVLLRRQFRAFQRSLQQSGTQSAKEYEHKLEKILVSQDIDMDKTYKLAQKIVPLRFPDRKKIDYEEFKRFSMFRNNETEAETGQLAVAGDIQGCVAGSCEMLQSGKLIIEEMKQHLHSRVPMLRMRTDLYHDERDKKPYFKVQMNPAFHQVFGYRDEELKSLLESSAAGFLPFGSSVLSYLVSRGSDLMSYLQVMCVKNSLEEPETLPWYTEIPTVQCLELNARKSPFEAGTAPLPFMLQTVYRRFMDEGSSYEEVYLLLKPLQSVDHLFELDPEFEFNVVNSLASSCSECPSLDSTHETKRKEKNESQVLLPKQEPGSENIKLANHVPELVTEEKDETAEISFNRTFAPLNPEVHRNTKRTRSNSLSMDEEFPLIEFPEEEDLDDENDGSDVGAETVDHALLELVMDGMSFNPMNM